MDQDIELRHLRYFVMVAEELHFGRAAERLHVSQPPLSQQIMKLEELLGYPLFVRTSRSVSMTSAGEAFLERAQRTLRIMQRDIDETRSIGRGEVGSLHLGFVGSGMLTTLPGIFRAYGRAYPGVRLHLYESFTSRVTEGMLNVRSTPEFCAMAIRRTSWRWRRSTPSRSSRCCLQRIRGPSRRPSRLPRCAMNRSSTTPATPAAVRTKSR